MHPGIQIVALVLSVALAGALLWFASVLHELIEKLRVHDAELKRQLDRMEKATWVVRDNLEQAISRADEADPNTPGASADAATRTAK